MRLRFVIVSSIKLLCSLHFSIAAPSTRSPGMRIISGLFCSTKDKVSSTRLAWISARTAKVIPYLLPSSYHVSTNRPPHKLPTNQFSAFAKVHLNSENFKGFSKFLTNFITTEATSASNAFNPILTREFVVF